MIRSLSVYILLILIVLQGCSMNFLEEEDTPKDSGGYSEYDPENDIKYYYNSSGDLQWYEYYDFNDQEQCVFVKHCLPSGTVLWSYVYAWSGSRLVTEAYFNSSNALTWYNSFRYEGENPVQQTSYDENSTVQWFMSWSYSGTGKALTAARYGSSGALEWAYQYGYDGSDTLILSSLYGSDYRRSAYITYEYDSSSRITKKTGWGATSSSDTFAAACSIPGFPSFGGKNTTSRNDAGLTAPTPPAAPSVPGLSLTDDNRSYSWMSVWMYDPFGYTSATLNADYLPVYMIRSAPDYLNGRPMEIDLTWENGRLTKKTTTYNGETVLNLDFTYNSGGYLTSLDTSGVSLYIPLRYEFTYQSRDGLSVEVPKSIRIYNENTLLQRFEYEYTGVITNPKDFAKNVSIINHYDGDGTFVGSYAFSYTDPVLTITVKDGSGTLTGRFELTYDTDGNTTSVKSYDASNNQVWDHQFDYAEYGSKVLRISETLLDENNHPEVADAFSVESFFEDLKRFLPL